MRRRGKPDPERLILNLRLKHSAPSNLDNSEITAKDTSMSKNAVRGRPFPPGVSGNLNGRPVGHRTRHQFSAAFAADLAEVWAEHGKSSMLHTARSSPETFFAVCSKLVPKDVELTIRQNYSGGLDETDLQILRAIRDAIPNANELEPQAVLEHTLNAIRSYDASKLIDAAREADTRDQNSQSPDKS